MFISITLTQTCKLIKRIQVDRTSARKAFVRRYDSAFIANGCRLLKELFKFIGNAKALQCVCFESTEIPIETLPLLGKSLTASKSRKFIGIQPYIMICCCLRFLYHSRRVSFAQPLRGSDLEIACSAVTRVFAS